MSGYSIKGFVLLVFLESPAGGDGIVAEEVVVGSTGLGFENIFFTLI